MEQEKGGVKSYSLLVGARRGGGRPPRLLMDFSKAPKDPWTPLKFVCGSNMPISFPLGSLFWRLKGTTMVFRPHAVAGWREPCASGGQWFPRSPF